MAFVQVSNVIIRGISATVPKYSQEVKDLSFFSDEEAEKFSSETGVERRRLAKTCLTTADLCYSAAEKLLDKLEWERNDIDCLLFVSQTPDYILPSTACILQDKLRLKKDIVAMEISLGCSGWIYGIFTISNLLSKGALKRGLLLVGDTISKTCSRMDKSTYPLFGDAGTVTAVEFNSGSIGFKFHLATDGSGADAIKIPDGAYRNMYSKGSSIIKNIDTGISRAPINLILDGMNVFSFGISRVPESVNSLIKHFNIDNETVDYFVFHQANLFMNEMIRKKLKIPVEKVPYTLRDFGNTSCAAIPLTIVKELREEVGNQERSFIACGFGVGLSWGSVWFRTENLVCPDIVEI
jgi:3-oxoacyl-[acyl-carrier-protein] synthase-3